MNSTWMKDADIRPDTIRLLEENIGQTLSDINDSNVFSDPPLRVMTVETKTNSKWIKDLNMTGYYKTLRAKHRPYTL